MYKKFYNLSNKPFRISPNPHFLYPSIKHRNALTHLEYGIEESSGFILLTGEIGTGKTTLIRYLLSGLSSQKEVASIFNTNVSSSQLLDLILQEFELPTVAGDKAKTLDLLYEFLIEKYRSGKDVLLVIDEAQNLKHEVLEELRMLSNLQTYEKNLLQIILVGQPELLNKIRHPSLMQLNQRIAVHYHLRGLNEKETREYIAARLEKVGGAPELFEDEAVSLIYEGTKGIPRLINIICDTALVYGYADGLTKIDTKIIEQVFEERESFEIVPESKQKESGSMLEQNGAGFEPEIHSRLAYLEEQMVSMKQVFKRIQHNENDERLTLVEQNLQAIKKMVLEERQRWELMHSSINDNRRYDDKQGDSVLSRSENRRIGRKGGWFVRLFR